MPPHLDLPLHSSQPVSKAPPLLACCHSCHCCTSHCLYLLHPLCGRLLLTSCLFEQGDHSPFHQNFHLHLLCLPACPSDCPLQGQSLRTHFLLNRAPPTTQASETDASHEMHCGLLGAVTSNIIRRCSNMIMIMNAQSSLCCRMHLTRNASPLSPDSTAGSDGGPQLLLLPLMLLLLPVACSIRGPHHLPYQQRAVMAADHSASAAVAC